MKKTILILALAPALFLAACSGNINMEKEEQPGELISGGLEDPEGEEVEITSITVTNHGGIASTSTEHDDEAYINAVMDALESIKVSGPPVSYNEAIEKSESNILCGTSEMDIELKSEEGTVKKITYIYGTPPYIGNDTYRYHEIKDDERLFELLNYGADDIVGADGEDTHIAVIKQDERDLYRGKFTDRKITDGESAILAARDAAEMLGYDDGLGELSLYHISQDSPSSGHIKYWLQTYYHDIPVYGGYFIIEASKEGEAQSIEVWRLKNIPEDISLTPKITYEDAVTAIQEFAAAAEWYEFDDIDNILDQNGNAELSDDSLVIYSDGDESRLAYLLITSGYEMIVDAETGDVLDYPMAAEWD